MSWLETLPALAIVAVAVASMGSLQSAVHKIGYGKVSLPFP